MDVASVSVSGCWQLLTTPAAASEGMCIITASEERF